MGQIATMKQAERIINAFGPDLFKALKLDDGPWHIIAQNIGSDEMNHDIRFYIKLKNEKTGVQVEISRDDWFISVDSDPADLADELASILKISPEKIAHRLIEGNVFDKEAFPWL